MTDWKKQQRQTELHRLLSKGRKFTLKQMAQEFGRSAKTISRDLHSMLADGLPVEYDPIEQTWTYHGEVAEFPALLISGEDRRALLFSLYATGQLEGAPVSGQIRQVYQRLLETLGPERASDFEAVMKQVHFAGQHTPPIAKQVWDVVLLSMEAKTTMHIHYVDGVFASKTQRDIDPYALIMRDRRWLLLGYCHYQKKVLTFSMHRIGSAESSENSFKMDPKLIQRYLTSGYGGYPATEKVEKVVLRIRKDAPPYVQEKTWSQGEQRRADKDGNTVVEFATAGTWAVVRDVLAEAGWVQILKPKRARDEVIEAVERMQK